MTSKEALSLLVYGLTNNRYAKEELPMTMSKCQEIIKEDLKVLEILKKNYANFQQLSSEKGIEQTIISFDIPVSELGRIKEWLEK